jgi:3-oxoacyl-[acyl-carrier-protein] synthase-3
VSTWLSGQLGMLQTHCSADIVAACAGLPYGLSEAVRLLQEVSGPSCWSASRSSPTRSAPAAPARMIFGDAAAAIVLAPAAPGEQTDVEVLQTYAGGPVEEVNSIIWPNPDFDGNVTVLGPDVRALAGRYLQQMIDELRDQDDPDGRAPTLLESIDLVVPHQANKTMVLTLAAEAGLAADRLFFNIETVGNTSAASIPLALADAKARGVLTGPMRIFAPGFGAGAVGGYAVLRVDPAVIAPERV